MHVYCMTQVAAHSEKLAHMRSSQKLSWRWHIFAHPSGGHVTSARSHRRCTEAQLAGSGPAVSQDRLVVTISYIHIVITGATDPEAIGHRHGNMHVHTQTPKSLMLALE